MGEKTENTIIRDKMYRTQTERLKKSDIGEPNIDECRKRAGNCRNSQRMMGTR